MKRSEAIKWLEDNWVEFSEYPDVDGDEILTLLENIGMLPPERNKIYRVDGKIVMTYRMCDWEGENGE